jgi:hypothetical protein
MRRVRRARGGVALPGSLPGLRGGSRLKRPLAGRSGWYNTMAKAREDRRRIGPLSFCLAVLGVVATGTE